jgi:hypothetical protein
MFWTPKSQTIICKNPKIALKKLGNLIKPMRLPNLQQHMIALI